MAKRLRPALIALVVVLALVAAACGSSDTTTTAAATTTSAATTSTGAMTTTTEAMSSTTEAMTSTSAASTEPIKIGMLADQTSTFTPWAVNVRDGMALAAKDINDAGGVSGRMIEIVNEDSQNDADIGVTAYERLAEDGVVAIGGILSSTVGAAVSPTAEELKIPTFLVKSGTPAALTQDSRYMFRTCLPAAPSDAQPILQYAQEQGLTKVGVIVADYEWGQGFKAAVENTFAGSGIDYGTIQVAPVPPSTDFTPFVRALADQGAQMVIATGHPPGNAAILSLSVDLIGRVPVTGAWTPPDLVVGGLGDTAVGIYSDFTCADYFSDSYQELARRYLDFSDNKFMSDDAVAGYGIVTMVAQAVGAVGDDPTAVDEYLHANSFDLPGYAYTMSWTAWGEQAAAQPIFTQINAGPAPDGVNDAGDWWFDELSQSEPLEPYSP
jgi:branched-chain amino acid transport system substrate-binding protein